MLDDVLDQAAGGTGSAGQRDADLEPGRIVGQPQAFDAPGLHQAGDAGHQAQARGHETHDGLHLRFLGDMGAEVIKVERPGTGDDTRAWGPPYMTDPAGQLAGESAYYMCANRNKLSVTIDFTQPEGQALVHQLAGQCDVLIENFKTGGLAQYGLDYATWPAWAIRP